MLKVVVSWVVAGNTASGQRSTVTIIALLVFLLLYNPIISKSTVRIEWESSGTLKRPVVNFCGSLESVGQQHGFELHLQCLGPIGQRHGIKLQLLHL